MELTIGKFLRNNNDSKTQRVMSCSNVLFKQFCKNVAEAIKTGTGTYGELNVELSNPFNPSAIEGIESDIVDFLFSMLEDWALSEDIIILCTSTKFENLKFTIRPRNVSIANPNKQVGVLIVTKE